MHNCEISLKNISKIEGHTHLDVKIRNNKVDYVRLKISENKRFYTQAIEDQVFSAAPQKASRICGTCSPAHLLCSIKAVENALGFEPTEQTIHMRELLTNGMFIRDHAMHLYFFCLPDLFGKDSLLDFNKSQHQWIHDGFDVKYAGNILAKLIGGRSVHPLYAVIGGFTRAPKKTDIKPVIETLKSVRQQIIKLIDVFLQHKYKFKPETNFVSVVTPNYNFLEGEIKSTDGYHIKEKEYLRHLYRIIVPYSNTTGFEFKGKPFMVGALARMNLNKKNIHADTKKDVPKALKQFPTNCIFHNNLAQAIESLHSIDFSIELLEKMDFKPEKIPGLKPKESTGIGVIEAPRGTLYYSFNIEKSGIIKDAKIVIPTAQNSTCMEKHIGEFVTQILDKSKEEIQKELEFLIRSYDPCMSCATHFLKVNWL